MKEIGLYVRAFPRVSEAFIVEQAHGMRRYEPTVIANTLLKQTSFPTVSVSHNDFLRVKQLVYLLTRSPNLFSQSDRLSKLALIHAHFGPDGVYAMALAEKLKIPFLVTFHGYDITLLRTAIWRTGKLLYYQLLFYEAQLQRKAARFIAVSNFIQNKLLEQGYPAEKIIQHYIGVDTTKFSPIGSKPEHRYILCVGRHTEKKGIDTLLSAFARIASKHPTVSLLQVGTGPLMASYQALVRALGIEHRVQFLGAKPHAEVLRLMQAAEIFALPSQTAKSGDSEALGIVFNEASACGIPVVSTKHGGIPEAVLHGETGLLVPEKDDVALADQLDILLSDRALSQKMGQRGREFVCEMFDLRRQTSKLEAIYDAIAS